MAGRLGRVWPVVGAGVLRIGVYLGNAVYSRIPVLLALAAVVLLVIRAADESKPIWPLNMPDVLYGMLFFFYGYGLYARRQLIDELRGPGTLPALLGAAAVAYLVHVVLLGVIDEANKQGESQDTIEFLWLVRTVFYGAAAALFSVGLVGLFERVLRAPQPWVRWLADSSYWIYIMHLPVVAFLTFYLAHLDRQGRLESLTGLSWSAEAKFLVACVADRSAGRCDVPIPGQVHASWNAAEREEDEGSTVARRRLSAKPALRAGAVCGNLWSAGEAARGLDTTVKRAQGNGNPIDAPVPLRGMQALLHTTKPVGSSFLWNHRGNHCHAHIHNRVSSRRGSGVLGCGMGSSRTPQGLERVT